MAMGECNCGAVAFEITGGVPDVIICHCSICRRSTGSNGIAVVVISKKNFRWLQGEEAISTWDKPGHDWQTRFCRICGSHLPGVNDETRIYAPAGLLTDGSEKLKVAHHIWVDSKASWDVIGDDGKQHQQALQT